MRPPRPTDRVDMGIGFLAFFGVVMLVATVACELTGRPALTWALVLLAIVVALVVEVRHRGAILRREGALDRPGHGTRSETGSSTK
ncbi:hypothetical protein [Frondihabitans cladoniiphilus]|uniref:Uncharacterized protein n=1 Tax=Frondihabitans cladoniiphilus TaxID=715785 RepID=A0ABP8VUR8_9MICO